MSVFNENDIVRYWPGIRPGRHEAAQVISDGVVQFAGTDCIRIKAASGGTDYIAITHVEQVGRVDGRRAYVKTAREAVEVCMLDVDDVVVEDREDSLMLQKLSRAFR